MLNSLLLLLYSILPETIIKFLGSFVPFKPLRDLILRKKGSARTIVIQAKWPADNLTFFFRADIRTALKLKKKPMEGLLLMRSLDLLKSKGSLDNNIILDVGSSFGYLSLVWAKTVSLHGTVFAFEVNPYVYDCLTYNVMANNLSNVVIPINRPVYSESIPILLDDGPSGSRVRTEQSNDLNNNYKQAISIDDFLLEKNIGRMDLIKIDVDGPEFDILKGAEKTLTKYRPIVIVEFINDERIPRWLTGLKYKLFDLKMQQLSHQKGINLICLP